MKQIIAKGVAGEAHRRRICDLISSLSPEKVWQVNVTPFVKKRTLPQNSYLHAVPLKMIADHTGHTVEDIKDYLLGEYAGWEVFEVLGSKRKRPIKRTSAMNAEEIGQFWDWIIAWAAENLGLLIPQPNEVIE